MYNAHQQNFKDMISDFTQLFPNILFNEQVREQRMNNVIKNKDSIVLEFPLPGFDKEDINIEVENRGFTISYKKPSNEKSKWKHSFEQAFKITDPVYDLDTISAKLDKGILSITIMKKEETKVKPKKVEIV